MWSTFYKGTLAGRVLPTTLTGYVLFFPHLIAGPILRPIELIPQLRHLRSALSAHCYAGLAVFTVGLMKKLVFGDQIAAVVDAAYKSDARGAPAAGSPSAVSPCRSIAISAAIRMWRSASRSSSVSGCRTILCGPMAPFR